MDRSVSISASGLGRTFGRRTIFSGLSFALHEHSSLAITGRNGSGKSTLLKILARVLSPTSGTVTMMQDGREIPGTEAFRHIGFVAPYFQLFDEFTGYENLKFARRIRGVERTPTTVESLLGSVNLLPRGNDLVGTYSSGMKQRLKYAFALLHDPSVLLLDEPTSNLDREGIAIVGEIIRQQVQRGIVIIATNDDDDVRRCDSVVSVEAVSLREEGAPPGL